KSTGVAPCKSPESIAPVPLKGDEFFSVTVVRPESPPRIGQPLWDTSPQKSNLVRFQEVDDRGFILAQRRISLQKTHSIDTIPECALQSPMAATFQPPRVWFKVGGRMRRSSDE